MINKQTTLDLNGPVLSFTLQPTSVSICDGESATFIGIATVFFPNQTPPNSPENSGSLVYQWYAQGFGALVDGQFQGATISGSRTTTLTISNATSPNLNGINFYLGVDYVASAYSQPSGSSVTPETRKSTGNAINEILNSNIVTLTVFPTISILQQPSEQTTATTIPTTFSAIGQLTDSSQGNISYRWQLNDLDLLDSSTVVGSATTTLTISLPNGGINTIRARLSHPTSCNSPIFTNSVNFNVVDPRQIVNYEIQNDRLSAETFGSINLKDSPLNFIGYPGIGGGAIEIYLYAPEKDLEVKVTMAGSRGANVVVPTRGRLTTITTQTLATIPGEGGLSSFKLLMRRNVEYHLRIGAIDVMNSSGGGGGATYMYEQSRLIAVCGGGGGAGTSGNGGKGGGINVSGESGYGLSPGIGGILIPSGTLQSTGYDPFVTTGGRAAGCPSGSAWVNAGFTDCQNYFGKSRDSSALSPDPTVTTVRGRGTTTTISNTFYSKTAEIDRGFKPAEWGYRTNGGNSASSADGGGGGGAVGGNAANGNLGSGGGGGSGYYDGSFELLSTQLGGNSSERGFVTIESL